MIVRLKVYFESYDNVFHMCFNSMIVRLKDSIAGFPVITCIMFQFYDSPIKSISASKFKELFVSFQFYDSPIKSLCGGWGCE